MNHEPVDNNIMVKYNEGEYEQRLQEAIKDGATHFIMDGHSARREDYRRFWIWLVDNKHVTVTEHSDDQYTVLRGRINVVNNQG